MVNQTKEAPVLYKKTDTMPRTLQMYVGKVTCIP